MPQPRAQFVLFDGFDPLDVIAPFEALIAGSDFLGGAFTVDLVSACGPGVVRSGTPQVSLTAVAALDPDTPGYVLVPGAIGPVDGDPDAGDETIPVLPGRFASSEAMAGLIEGRAATAHVLGLDLLEHEFGSKAAHDVEELFEYERRGVTLKSERQLAA